MLYEVVRGDDYSKMAAASAAGVVCVLLARVSRRC